MGKLQRHTAAQYKISYPHHQSRSKDGYPWIGPELKKMMRRLHRYNKTKKKTGHPQHIKRHLDLKHQVQKRQRQACWEYVESIVTTKEQENEYSGMKRFWTYVNTEDVSPSQRVKANCLATPSTKLTSLTNSFNMCSQAVKMSAGNNS